MKESSASSMDRNAAFCKGLRLVISVSSEKGRYRICKVKKSKDRKAEWERVKIV